jgi:hypothetical protein
MPEPPDLAVEPLGADRWRVTNRGRAPVRLLETWLPHGRFRGAPLRQDRSIAPGQALVLATPVAASGAAGEVVENAFLILRLEGWRVLARLSIRFDERGAPRPEVVVVTSQRAGFSGVED